MAAAKQKAQIETGNLVQELKDSCRQELDRVKRDLREIDTTIQQSQADVNRHAQRNASTTMQLQQAQSQLENMSRADIRTVYDAALDAQQRLFVMRGQLDKLQGDKAQLTRMQAVLERILEGLERIPIGSDKDAADDAAQTVEMLIQAQESERLRLSRRMHDGPTQSLSNFILQTEIAMRLFDKDQAKAREELVSLKTAASATFQNVRGFIFELRPMMLDDLGLVPTLNRYVENFKEQSKMDVRFTASGMDGRLESFLEVMIFRAVQELLGNAARHSQATQVRLQIDLAGGELRLMIEDNGQGFDTATLANSSGMGLKIIRDRVDMLGGEFNVEGAHGQGTRVSFSVPAQLRVA